MSIVKHTINKVDDKVIFTKEFTKTDVERSILALALHCRSSQRGIKYFLRDALDYGISLGNVNGILQKFGKIAAQLNVEDLSKMKVAALDEIFQGDTPVLAAVDAKTGFIGLLSKESSRDSTAWGVNLIDLDKRGYNPKYVIADGARGLRAGHALVFPDIPCYGDVFHAIKEINELAYYRSNRAYHKLGIYYDASKKGKTSEDDLKKAQEEADMSIHIADTIAILGYWLQNDVLSIVGQSYDERIESYDFIVGELEKLYELRSCKRIKRAITYLKGQKKNLLMFVKDIDEILQAIAEKYQVPYYRVRQLFELQNADKTMNSYWIKDDKLRKQLNYNYLNLITAIEDIPNKIVRASSWAENINSRLRDYFTLVRQIGQGFLDLLQFYFNYKPFSRSEHPERVGKSPKELLTGQSHAPWLDMLIEHKEIATA